MFEDKDDGDVWAHEGRLAAAPPAPEGACCIDTQLSLWCVSQEPVSP